MLIPDENKNPLLYLCAESYPEQEAILKFIDQARNGMNITYTQKPTKDKISSIYIEPISPPKKEPFWKKWFKK